MSHLTLAAAIWPLNESLRHAGARHNLYMGSQFKGKVIDTDQEYRAMHAQEYSLSTVGNQCKWAATQPSKGTFSLENCIRAHAYAISVDQQFRGHNLCWGNDNPRWLTSGAFSSSELASLLKGHIHSVMQGVKTAAGASPLAWDVVNEAANNTSPFKPNTWYPALPDYVDVAFRAARAADNTTLLFYNDFGISAAGSAKSDVVYEMVRSMVKRGVPIDGVHITELDVKCQDPCTPARLDEQADVYGTMLRACLEHPGVCTSYETWGFTDKYTWLTGARCPTAACHPLPFDAAYRPKPAAHRMLWVLQHHGVGEV